jgi:uncharacterized protein (TIGR03437 family)
MKHPQTVLLSFFACLLATPLLAQTTIGGGTCSSATVSGSYGASITGRQLTSAGKFTNVLQANGVATFDGQSKVTFAMTQSTLQTIATPLNWSGTYSVQANCAAQMTITTGGSATFNLAIYNGGTDILFTGSDATYSYSGSADTQPATGCSTAALAGSYIYSAAGYNLSSGAVVGSVALSGLFQFDGQGNVTVSATINGTKTSAGNTGTYSLSSNCLGTATLTLNGSPLTVAFNVYNVASSSPSDIYMDLGQSGNFIVSGTAHTVTNQTCSASTFNGVYSLTLSGRAVSPSGTYTGTFHGVGSITFDGVSKVTLSGTANTNLAAGKAFTYSGTYTLASNCSGTVTLTQGSSATFALQAWSNGQQHNLTGSDSTYNYSGSGGSNAPPACGTPTLSGGYVYDSTGPMLSGTALTSVADESGTLQFDGQGNVTAIYTISSSQTTPSQLTSSGTYTLGANCQGSATLKDSNGATNTLTLVVTGIYGQNALLLEANPQFIRTGAAHSSFDNPSESIANVASYAYSATPAGSVFTLFGVNLATTASQATVVPLPTKLLTTSVLVNGTAVPLFYVSSGQIDAQMPWEIPGNTLATVIVKNTGANGSTSNAAAVWVPATGTPGIAFYSNNRATVVNADGNENSPTDTASVGDEVVMYFTGGGPVNASGKLTTGSPAPLSLSPVTDPSASVTVGGVTAIPKYIGLTPGSIGLYQTNFIVPQLAKGAYPVVLTISGTASNTLGGVYPNAVMNVGN